MSVTKNHVLIVDDMEIYVTLVAEILDRTKINLSSVPNALDVIPFLLQNRVDLILLDINMPGKSGYEICRELKKDSRFHEIPVIFLTSDDNEESVIQGFEVGAQDYITKPFRAKELIARVNTHLLIHNQNNLLKNSNDTLEQKVQERTEELEIAKSRLERFNKAKEDFLILINHELRTPLNGITGVIQLLELMELPDEQKEYLDILKKSVGRLTRISEMSLMITGLKLQNVSLSFKKINLCSLLNESLNHYDPSIKNKAIRIINMCSNPDESCEECSYSIFCDSELIIKTFDIILDNAIKNTQQNGVIKIKYYKAGSMIAVEIEDNGNGFNENILNHLFELFVSADNQQYKEGWGLGLYLAKIIMESHNGRIEAGNRDHQGAFVKLLFPEFK